MDFSSTVFIQKTVSPGFPLDVTIMKMADCFVVISLIA